MGELVDDMLEGFRCAECLDVMPDGEAPGHPRLCASCNASGAAERHASQPKRSRRR